MFDKIVTVSVNPALDVTLWVQTMDFSEPNLTTRETVYAGGKSINISRVLSALHTSSRLLGICGEDHFSLFSSLLKKDRVDFSFLTVLGGVRENLTLIVPDKRVLKINRAGCPVPTHAMKELRDRIQTETADCKRVLLVFAGSLPPNLTADAYKEFILSFRREGVFFALDTAFFNLNDIREIAPFIIKPNLVEFQAMCGHDLKTEEDVVKSCKPLTPYVAHILVSLGSEGLVYVGENECYRLTTSSVSVKSTIGAGDTTLAAFIHSLQEEKSLSEALMFAIAAGTASVTLDGTDIVTLQDIKNRLPHIILRMI